MTRIFLAFSAMVLAGLSNACTAAGTERAPNNDPVAANTSQSAAGRAGDAPVSDSESPAPVSGQPKTIRDFFMLLPEEYFVLEGCDKAADKDCKKAKLEYLKTFAEVEDTANGYLKGGCDGGQSCLVMTIFKRPDASYLIAVSTEAEMLIQQHFLDYRNGKWSDVTASVVPEYSKDHLYELPRQGTAVKVFSKKVIEKGDDYEAAEKGARLYDLDWKEGKFSIKR